VQGVENGFIHLGTRDEVRVGGQGWNSTRSTEISFLKISVGISTYFNFSLCFRLRLYIELPWHCALMDPFPSLNL
jgi:hypothetical protein